MQEAREYVNQVYGQVYTVLVSQFRFKLVFILMPLIALAPVYFALVFKLERYELLAALTGAVVAPAIWVGTGILSGFIMERDMYKYIEMLIASPIRPSVYIASRLLAGLAASSLYTLPLVILYTYTTGDPIAGLHAVSMILLVSLSLTPFSLLLALRLREARDTGNIPALLSMILSFIPPVYYPSSSLPPLLAKILVLVPSAAAAETLRTRALPGYTPAYDPAMLTLYLIIVAVGGIVLAHTRLSWTLD